MAPRSYRVLMPHPTLIAHADFPWVARMFHDNQMNAAEVNLLDPATDNLVVLADRLLDLVGEDHDLAITNGDQVGRLRADGQWWPIVPAPVETTSDVGAGDMFGMAWVIARRFFHAGAPEALDYALRARPARTSAAAPSWPTRHRPIRLEDATRRGCALHGAQVPRVQIGREATESPLPGNRYVTGASTGLPIHHRNYY